MEEVGIAINRFDTAGEAVERSFSIVVFPFVAIYRYVGWKLPALYPLLKAVARNYIL